MKLPVLDYAVGAASGTVLAGELGTEKLRFYDVLGQPVNQAFRLIARWRRGAASRTSSPPTPRRRRRQGASGPSAVETDMVEIGADKLRLFKLEG